ncbi:MAG: methylisocitrate lyase [Verrucomicrobia bacterium]|jgi:methylisocitrate lyase|nr:methylisocitrate lyase [Verrucomicrobiota bacterium]
MTAGKKFREAVRRERPLQVVGVIHALAAKLAEEAGFRAVYVSGAGVANACFGKPDLGLTTLEEVAEEVKRISSATRLPILVDIDTGWGRNLFSGRAMKLLHRSGAAAVQLEDQVEMKRCGHRPGKRLVAVPEMVRRIRAAVTTRPQRDMVVMARTDAAAVEGLDAAIARAQAYVRAGADMIFAEALGSLSSYKKFCQAVPAPVLANMTEFGKTPMFRLPQFRSAGLRLVLYPLSAFRAMNAAASMVFRTIRRQGTQRSLLRRMQTRQELYRLLDYQKAERQVDRRLRNRR